MPKFRLYFIAIVACLFCTLAATAQMQQQPVEMADAMRSNGKIYVVVAVLTTILAGIVLYLIRLEKKIKRLEKE
jgi:presenilin-like A22 family membrane protease